MKKIEELNATIEKELKNLQLDSEQSLQELFEQAKSSYNEMCNTLALYNESGEIIPYQVLLLEHNIIALEQALTKCSDNTQKRAL